ncbi:hypothetical protein ACFE04_030171 [Oxalis oulophora]
MSTFTSVSLSSPPSQLRTFSLYNNNNKQTSFLSLKPTTAAIHKLNTRHHRCVAAAATIAPRSFTYNPLRCRLPVSGFNSDVAMVRSKRGLGTVCYAAPVTVRNLQWIAAIASTVLMIAKGTAAHKSFLVPLFALQAPGAIISWIKGEYGVWSAFLALLVRLFFYIPGELELPFMALLLIIVAPRDVMNLRGTKEGGIIALAIAAYLAFQHFSRVGSLEKAYDQHLIIPSVAVTCITAVSIFLLV